MQRLSSNTSIVLFSPWPAAAQTGCSLCSVTPRRGGEHKNIIRISIFALSCFIYFLSQLITGTPLKLLAVMWYKLQDMGRRLQIARLYFNDFCRLKACSENSEMRKSGNHHFKRLNFLSGLRCSIIIFSPGCTVRAARCSARRMPGRPALRPWCRARSCGCGVRGSGGESRS